jgi:hypothetical protein
VHQALLFAAWFFGFIVVASAVCWALTIRSLRRANRVVAGRRTAAPISWLWSWREPARLHRRLRRAVAMARAAVASPLSPPTGRRRAAPATMLSTLAAELAEHAVAIDERLVAAGRMRSLLPALAQEVHEVERSAARLSSLAGAWRAQVHQAALTEGTGALDFGSRLDAFEAAMAELGQPGSAR